MARFNGIVPKRQSKGQKPALGKNLYYRGDVICMRLMHEGQMRRETTDIKWFEPNALQRAQEVLVQARVNIRSGRRLRDTGAQRATTLEGILDLYIDTKRHRLDRTKAARARLLCAHFGSDFDPMRLTSGRVERYVEAREETRSHLGGHVTPNTIKRELNVLRAALRYAKGEGMISELPDYNEPRLRILVKDRKRTAGKRHEAIDVDAFIATLPIELASLFRFARLTGARKDELMRLKRSQIVMTGDATCPAEVTLVDTKTKVPRTLQLNGDALAAIRDAGHSERELIWHIPSVSQLVYHYNRKAKRAPGDFITLRDMRHEVASRMYNSGMDILHVMQQLGHTLLATAQRYIHKSEAERRGVHRSFWGAQASAPERVTA